MVKRVTSHMRPSQPHSSKALTSQPHIDAVAVAAAGGGEEDEGGVSNSIRSEVRHQFNSSPRHAHLQNCLSGPE